MFVCLPSFAIAILLSSFQRSLVPDERLLQEQSTPEITLNSVTSFLTTWTFANRTFAALCVRFFMVRLPSQIIHAELSEADKDYCHVLHISQGLEFVPKSFSNVELKTFHGATYSSVNKSIRSLNGAFLSFSCSLASTNYPPLFSYGTNEKSTSYGPAFPSVSPLCV